VLVAGAIVEFDGAWAFVRRHARAFSIVPPASRCGPGSGVFSRSCQEGARRESVDPNYAQIRQQIIVVGDQRPFRRCAQRCEFSIVRSRTRTKALGSTGPLNSPSGWKRLATFSQSRRRIRRRIISISRWVDWFHISRKRPSRTAARTHADALLGLKPAATNTLVRLQSLPSWGFCHSWPRARRRAGWMPGPTAMMSPSMGFSWAVSGMMIL